MAPAISAAPQVLMILSRPTNPFYVYVFPCVIEDLCKLGFSRDPLARLAQSHSRWFEFFDIDAGTLLGADSQREARDLELALRRPLARVHRSPMPLTIRLGAGGKTEWMRGAMSSLHSALKSYADQGFDVLPLRPWLVDRLSSEKSRLYEWAEQGLSAGAFGSDRIPPLASILATLDAYRACGIDPEPLIPDEAWQNYRRWSKAGSKNGSESFEQPAR